MSQTPHGAPDWYQYRTSSTTFPVDDLAELAVRLKSPVAFDRRGDVIWYDTFDGDSPGWSPLFSGAGSSVALSPDYALYGGYSLKLTTGRDLERNALTRRFLTFPVVSKIGVQWAFTIADRQDYFYFDTYLYDGVTLNYTRIQLDITNTRLRYLDSGNVLRDIATGLRFSTLAGHFNHLKIVSDFVNNTYHRLIFNEVTYDLSSYALYNVLDPTVPHLRAYFILYGIALFNPATYLDHCIVTQDEP